MFNYAVAAADTLVAQLLLCGLLLLRLVRLRRRSGGRTNVTILCIVKLRTGKE